MTDDDVTESREQPTDRGESERAGAAEATTPERTHTPGTTAVVVDAMLGKLATYLRMCGYDATYTGERGLDSESETLAVAATEDRVVLTRDRALAARAERSVLLTEREVEAQLAELREAGFVLELADEPARCSACNAPLERVDRTEPTPDYAPETHERPVWRCRQCGQHFWKGSHWADVERTLDVL
jgi:uncharacterized protein with PIN domain